MANPKDTTGNKSIILTTIIVGLLIVLSVAGIQLYSNYSKSEDQDANIISDTQESNVTSESSPTEEFKDFVLRDGNVYIQSITEDETLIAEAIDEDSGEEVIEILVSETKDWLLYKVYIRDITNAGEEKIGEIFEWRVYNRNYGGVVVLNGKKLTTNNGLIITINKAEKWISENEIIVIDDQGMTWNGVLIYNAETDTLRELTDEEMVSFGYEGLF